MMLWVAVIVAALIAFSLKLAGFLVPESALSHPRARRITAAIPIAMLAALVATQTFGGSQGTLVVDARLAAVGVAVWSQPDLRPGLPCRNRLADSQHQGG